MITKATAGQMLQLQGQLSLSRLNDDGDHWDHVLPDDGDHWGWRSRTPSTLSCTIMAGFDDPEGDDFTFGEEDQVVLGCEDEDHWDHFLPDAASHQEH